jgi:hypothetical protein
MTLPNSANSIELAGFFKREKDLLWRKNKAYGRIAVQIPFAFSVFGSGGFYSSIHLL